jgi:predicted MFS family arabinose efflux permease
VIAGAVLYFLTLALVPLASASLAFPLLVAAEFGSGFGLIVHDICEGSIRQALTPDALRSRVMGAYLLLNNGSRPLGALAGGALGTWIGLRATLWVAIAGGVASSLLMLASRLARLRELPAEAVWDAPS